MPTTDDEAQYPPDDGPLTDAQLRAIADAVRSAHGEATVLENLLTDPATARLVLAWRRSVIELEAARQAAIDAGDTELVRWVDGAVRGGRDDRDDDA